MDDKDKLIAELRQLVADLQERLQRQDERIAELELQLAKAQKDSSTSSKAPSSDIVKPPKKPTNRRQKRQRGGQKGHQRNRREPLPPGRVDETTCHEIDADEIHQRQLTPTDEFEIIQHIELLEFPIYVTEHRLRKYRDRDGNTVLPEVPGLKDQALFGPRLLALIGWLKSRGHASYTTIATFMNDVLQVPVSRGYLAKRCNGVISASLAEAHDVLKAAIPAQDTLGSDETSLKNNGKKHWIWCLTAPLFTVFHIAASRGRKVLEELIGSDYEGHLHCDYFSSNCSFAWHFDIKAQYCWAHLIRDIRFLQKHPDKPTQRWAEHLLDRTRRLFSAWHRRDEMTDDGFHRSMIIHRDRFLTLVRHPPPDVQEAANLTARFAVVELEDGNHYDMSTDYFRFMFAPGVEPTNNHSEQQIRHCVIDRRITQGTRSAAGQRYHERMWTAIATCAKQGRSFFDFLHGSIDAHLNGRTAPSLLPD